MNWIKKTLRIGEKIKRLINKHRPTKEEMEKSDWTSCCKGPILKKDLEVIKSLIPTHDNVKVRGNTFVKETFWYLIRFLGDSKSKMMPEKKEGITKCKWLTPSEIVLIMKDSRPLVHYLLEFVLQDSDYKNFRKDWRKL